MATTVAMTDRQMTADTERKLIEIREEKQEVNKYKQQDIMHGL